MAFKVLSSSKFTTFWNYNSALGRSILSSFCFDLVHHVHTRNHLPKHNMSPIQPLKENQMRVREWENISWSPRTIGQKHNLMQHMSSVQSTESCASHAVREYLKVRKSNRKPSSWQQCRICIVATFNDKDTLQKGFINEHQLRSEQNRSTRYMLVPSSLAEFRRKQ